MSWKNFVLKKIGQKLKKYISGVFQLTIPPSLRIPPPKCPRYFLGGGILKYSIGSPLWKIRPEAGNFWDFAPKTEQKTVFWEGKNTFRHPQNPQKSPAAHMNMSDTILQASVDWNPFLFNRF